MTHGEALTHLRLLAAGLGSTPADVERLFERVAHQDDADQIRAALMNAGARVTLEEAERGRCHICDRCRTCTTCDPLRKPGGPHVCPNEERR